MWGFKRKEAPKQLPDLTRESVITEFREQLGVVNQFIERLELAEKDIVNLNTALNRVERKQSKWLEILNEKEDPARVAKLNAEATLVGQQLNPRQPECGEETE